MHQSLSTCKNCGNTFSGKFCNQCGEKVYTEHDKSVVHFLDEGVHFLTHFEGSFFTTVKTIFLRPGRLSMDYCGGIRKRYFKPLSFFLLLVILYLLFPFFEGLNMRMVYHTKNRLYGGYAQHQVTNLLQKKGITEAELTDLFHQKSEKASKFLLVIIVPLTALCLWAVTFRKRNYFFDQMVFSAEANCFYLLWGFLLLPLLVLLFQWVYHWATSRYIPFRDGITGFLVSIPLLIYVAIAGKRFYRLKLAQAVLFCLFFLVAHTFVVHYLYKFILFVIVINQIH